MGAADGTGRRSPLISPKKAAHVLIVGFALDLVGMGYAFATSATELGEYLVVCTLLLALATLFLTARYDSI